MCPGASSDLGGAPPSLRSKPPPRPPTRAPGVLRTCHSTHHYTIHTRLDPTKIRLGAEGLPQRLLASLCPDSAAPAGDWGGWGRSERKGQVGGGARGCPSRPQRLGRGGYPGCSLAGRSLPSPRLQCRRRVTHATACGRPHISLCVYLCVWLLGPPRPPKWGVSFPCCQGNKQKRHNCRMPAGEKGRFTATPNISRKWGGVGGESLSR